MCFQLNRFIRRTEFIVIAGTALFLGAWTLHSLHSKVPNSNINRLQRVPKPRPSNELYELPKSIWPAPARDETESAWPYDLFTPPIIELHDGAFHAREAAVTTLHLLQLEEVVCRFRLEGFAINRDGTRTAFIRNLESGKMHMVNDGETSAEGKFSLESCHFPRGSIDSRCATVRDELTGKIHLLPLGREADVNEFRIRLLGNRYGVEERHELSKIGEIIRHEDVDYEFAAVDGDSILLKHCAGGAQIRLYLSEFEPFSEQDLAAAL
ncbi:MAG: hypothetical protein LBB38_03295 [Puniceicoccales bacterium]|jgi:hypothetical protein|nr:hypothetical protein [Puniceicoccales bacterium]